MSSRSKRMIDAVIKDVVSDSQNMVAVNNSNRDHRVRCYEPMVKKKDSPLPSDADISEINQMMDLLSDSEEIICQSCNNSLITKQSFSDDSPAEENITQHPSPDCSLNHLDYDCDNHFKIPIPKDILPLQPVNSNITDLAYTPHANTPLSSYSDATQVSRKWVFTPRKDKGNIRRRHVTEWKDNKRKILRNLGKEYIKSRDGTVRKSKSMGPVCHANCRLKCLTNISHEERL
ncbi:unnamed protein product [Parnassius apollo]|uniref:(apollo) hypothetical protein n=1 Tax=Parnassius apollo TaxID=110799 RepID=A0A8S3WGV2_PARAO|nr:unnamed protein product [Parnassius apollo]